MINTTNKSAKNASFSSGIMLSRSEAQRQKGDELRMRAAGIDPTKIDEQWLGEVMSRRQKKEAKVDEDVEKEKKLAAELPMEKSEVVSKRPEGRFTWLHKALVLAAKGRIPVPEIYNIIQSSKFTSGVSSKVGMKMKGLVLANLHLFKKEQQKSLQNGRLMDFSKDGGSGSEDEKKKSKKRKHSESYSESSRHSRSRSRSTRRSDSRKKKKKRKKEKEKEKEKDRSGSHDDRSHDEKREKESDDGAKKKKKDKAAKEKKEEKAPKEEKAHKEKKEEKSKKEKSHKEEKLKEKPGKDEKKSKAAREAAAKLAQAEEELAKATEEEPDEAEEEPEEPEDMEASMSSTNFQEVSQFDARFPPQAAPAGAMGTVKMKLSGWKPACLRM